jgi:ATP-dependent DNA ligase
VNVEAKMPTRPRFISPMECVEVDQIPEGELWYYELKLRGHRTIAVKQNGEVTFPATKTLNSKFPSGAQDARKTPNKKVILDGEIVALDERGSLSSACPHALKRTH